MQISNIITEETKEYIKSENEKIEEKKIWGENIQCHYIPYKPAKKPLAKLIKKPATSSAFVTDFSMRYDNVTTNKEVTAQNISKPVSKVYMLLKVFLL